jgi:hypothetical protein
MYCARRRCAFLAGLQAGFAIAGSAAYIKSMPKTMVLPPAVARRFVQDMRAFHAVSNAIKADEIAARQLHALKQHYAGKLRLTDLRQSLS